MIIETLSTFPDMYASVMGASMMRRAQEKGILQFVAHDLRDWTHDRHRTTDDDPYGGGHGLVMKCEPIFEAYDSLCKEGVAAPRPHTVFLAPHGEPFDDAIACAGARGAPAVRVRALRGHRRARLRAGRPHALAGGLRAHERGAGLHGGHRRGGAQAARRAGRGRRGRRREASPTGCSNTRSTRVPPASAAWTCPPCSSRATTAPWAGGAGRPRSRRRRACAPTFWKRPGFRPLIGNF